MVTVLFSRFIGKLEMNMFSFCMYVCIYLCGVKGIIAYVYIVLYGLQNTFLIDTNWIFMATV